MIHFLADRKILPARLISNSLEFEGIKTGVVNAFPDAGEGNHAVHEVSLDADDGGGGVGGTVRFGAGHEGVGLPRQRRSVDGHGVRRVRSCSAQGRIPAGGVALAFESLAWVGDHRLAIRSHSSRNCSPIRGVSG